MNTYEVFTNEFSQIIQADSISEAMVKFDAEHSLEIICIENVAYRSTPTHGRTAEEIITSVHSEFKIKYPNNPIPDTITDTILLEIVIKAMHDFRNQPQQVREEVECTHPYKECVMSDRVNKYGTPLTKCSVCGNDNICDEELMDESVNTFTKEDILAAFCAAEEYVDFNRWFENYKTK